MSLFASRYAGAFAAAVDDAKLDPAAISQQLDDFAFAWNDSQELRQVLTDPVLPATQKVAVLDALNKRIGLSPLVRNFLAVLIDNDRIAGFNEVVDSRIHNNGFPGGSETNGHGLYITGSDNTFTGNDVYANQGYGFHIYNNSGSRADPSRNLVSGNRIHGNGVHGGTAYGLLVAWGDSNRIQGNTIFENPGGILVYTNSTNTDVSNNNIYNNRPLEGIIVQYADATVVRNNTVSGNGTDIIDYGDATVFSQNSVPAKRGGPAR